MTKSSSNTPVLRRRKKTPHKLTEKHPILDGAAKVVRTTKSGGFWSLSYWITEESKYLRKSLHTRNLEEAKELGREKYFEIKADIKSGNKIFSKTAEQLVNDFIKHKKDEADAEIITHERVETIRISLNKWFLKYVGHKKRLEKITRNDFKTYFVWRRKQAPSVKNATLTNERALISSLFKYGIENGYLKHDQKPIFSKLNLKKSSIERRDDFDMDEWERMFRSFRRWVSKSDHEKEKEQRKFIKDQIIILANTGLRPGEVRKLKWGMIKTYKSNQLNERRENQTHVEIQVPHDTKTGARTAIGRRGDVFERIKKYSKHTKRDDWIFCNNETGEPIHKKVYYKQWASLMKESGLDELNKNVSYYSLRHTYITFRLLAETNPFFLAQNVGTSLKMIENHYAHVKSRMIKFELTKDMKLNEANQILIG